MEKKVTLSFDAKASPEDFNVLTFTQYGIMRYYLDTLLNTAIRRDAQSEEVIPSFVPISTSAYTSFTTHADIECYGIRAGILAEFLNEKPVEDEPHWDRSIREFVGSLDHNFWVQIWVTDREEEEK